jgi:hypothetical protein
MSSWTRVNGRTRISAIPALARVSPETVSTYLETKPAMLACILEVALEGPGDRFALVDWP